MNLQAQASLDNAGQPFLITGTVQDITERKKIEEALRESKNFLQGVFDAIPDGICILDPELNVIRINQGVRKFIPFGGFPGGAEMPPAFTPKGRAVFQLPGPQNF